MKAAIYARYSSDMQRSESIDAQFRAITGYCDRKGYTIVKKYADEAYSGRNDDRPQYQQMLADSKKNIFDVVIFHKIDRHSRNEYDYYVNKAKFLRNGVTLEYAEQNIDNSPEGMLLETFSIGIAAYTSRNLSKETKKGLMENAHKAQFNGGTPPLGFDIDKDKHYIINEHESEAVKIIFNRYLEGYGYGKIIEELKSKRFKTKSGKDFVKNSLHDILKNKKYAGDYTYNKVNRTDDGVRNSHKINENMFVLENSIPAIIDRDTFNLVQLKMNENRKMSNINRYKAKYNYLLSGLVFCECGSAMIGKTVKKKNNKLYQYYICNKKDRSKVHECKNKYIEKDVIEKEVFDAIKEQVFTEKNIKKITKKLIEYYNETNQETIKRRTNLINQKNGLERKLNNVYKLIEDGEFDKRDKEHFSNLKKELDIIESRIEEFSHNNVLTEQQIEDAFKNLKEEFKKENTPEKLRSIANLFVRHIVVDSEGIQVQLCVSFEGVALRMVPRTGIEPVRISLSAGF